MKVLFRLPQIGLLLALAGTASAQVTLLNATFEGDTPGNLPAGWTSSSNTFKAVANPSASGINTSANVGGWTGTDSTDGVLINLTGYTSGYTFTLAFDLYDPDSTNTHGLLTGYGVSGTSSDAWTIGATGANSGATMFDNLSATSTWQHFSFDFTPIVSTYLSAHPGQAASFAIMFDMWNVGNGTRPNLDNVTFTATAVPEPSTYAAIAGAAALGLAALRRRRLAV